MAVHFHLCSVTYDAALISTDSRLVTRQAHQPAFHVFPVRQRIKQQARVTIDALKALGLRISIDDFGTGFSSLNYLRQFAVDYLKIDRSFVVDIASNPRDRAVVVAIIELAKALNIEVVAEGVETESQAKFFSEAHCDELQGYLFGRPLPIDSLERHMAEASSVDDERRATTRISVRELLQLS